MRNKGARRDNSGGAQHIRTGSTAVLSRRLHSRGLSGPSLSHLTSPLNPPHQHTPSQEHRAPPPRPPPGISATFHPRPCPRLLLSFFMHPAPFDTHTHRHTPEGPYCLRGPRSKYESGGGGGESSCRQKRRITDVKF